MPNNYDIFKDNDLEVADRIQRLRLRLLVHSCIYYGLNYNMVSDKVWDSWARELVELQNNYPDISEQVCWYSAFKDWDGNTGAFLPIEDKWVVNRAIRLSGRRIRQESIPDVVTKSNISSTSGVRKLF